MTQEISFSGLAAIPSDYTAPDGQLDLACNLINEDGSQGPFGTPRTILDIGTGRRLFLHRVGDQTRFLTYDPGSADLIWIATQTLSSDPVALTDPVTIFTAREQTIISVTSVGYVIVLCSDLFTHYAWYNPVAGAYIYLGTHLPDMQLQFGLRLHYESEFLAKQDFEVLDATGSNSISTPDDLWENFTSLSYHVNGQQLHMDGLFCKSDPVPFFENFFLVKGTEYKFHSLAALIRILRIP